MLLSVNIFSSALLQYRIDGGSDASFALVNAGGIRATIDAGPITRGQVLTSFPFGNAVVEVTYSGADLWKIFEGAVSGINQFNQQEVTSFFQVSRGIKVEYNPNNAVGSQLVRLTIGDAAVDQTAEYKIVTVDFITGGGDNILEPVTDVVVLDTMEEVLVEHIQKTSPIDFELDGRIAVVEGSASGSNSSGNATVTTGAPAPTSTPSSAERVSGVASSVVLLVFTALLAFVVW